MPHELLAGAARADITPEMGMQLAGDIGRHRPVEEIRERLYANALVIEMDGRRMCILSADLPFFNTEWSDIIRNRTAQRFGMQPDTVMVHTTQNHAAPSVGHGFLIGSKTRFPDKYPWLKGGEEAYNEPTVQRCIDAIAAAVSNLEPVTIQAGRGIDGRVAFNRRFVMLDGTAKCHPIPGDPNILHVEGPTDPAVNVVTFTNTTGKVVSALLHHTCHPCHGYPHNFVIGDWPGVWSANMRTHWGGDCVPLVINGCCGNIHHTDHLTALPRHNHIEMAGMLTETTLRVLQTMEPIPLDEVTMGRSVVQLKVRTPNSEAIAEAAALLEAYPEPKWLDEEKTRVDWDWVYAVNVLDLADAEREKPIFDYEILTFGLGALNIVALMGEPFVESQLEIKQALGTPHTFVAHFCNGYAGYLPTRKAFEGGGYETRTGCGSRLQHEALEQVTAAAIAMLK